MRRRCIYKRSGDRIADGAGEHERDKVTGKNQPKKEQISALAR